MTELVPYLPGLFLTLTIAGFGMLMPGPAVMAIAGTSMRNGRRQGMALAGGVITGSFIWSSLAAFGLSAVLAAHADWLVWMRRAGGFYLLWLAFKAFRSVLRADAVIAVEAVAGGLRRAYLKGLGIHLTNPKAVLGWAAAMTLGLDDTAPLAVLLILLTAAVLIASTINMGYALAFSSRPMVNIYARSRRGLELAFGALFAGAGLKLLASGS